MRRAVLALGAMIPLALVAESWCVLWLLSVKQALAPAEILFLVSLHLVAAVCSAEGLRLRFPPGSNEGRGAWRMGLSLSLLLPVFGLAITVVLTARPPPVDDDTEADEDLSPMEHRTVLAEAQRRAEAGLETADLSVETLGDSLKDANKDRRLGAVEALRKMESKEAVQLLNRSLENTIFEVRYHVVEALARIDEKYSQRIAAATEAVAQDPSPDNHRILGEVYHEFASMEMEDPSIQEHLYRSAAGTLKRSILPGFPTPIGVRVKLGYCYERLGRLDEALEKYQSVVDEIPMQTEALLGIARLQFRQAQLGPLAATCRRIMDLKVSLEDHDASAAVTYWGRRSTGEGG